MALSLRVPGWCDAASLRDDAGEDGPPLRRGRARSWRRGRGEPGDAVDAGAGDAARVTRPDPRVDAVRGCVALERGPLVYAIETADLPAGVELEDVSIRPDRAPPTTRGRTWRAVRRRPVDAGPTSVDPSTSGAIPYFAWANRSPEAMRVWIPRASADDLAELREQVAAANRAIDALAS